MASFSARTRAEAVVLAPRQDIWDALVDPDLVARLTPFVRRITAAGDRWCWELSGFDVVGLKVAPSFTERMVLIEPRRIEFHHDPPRGTTEKAGVEGWYELTPAGSGTEDDGDAGDDGDDGTSLVTELEITVDLPLPKVSGPAVRAAMRRVVDTMGDRFSRNLLDHLGAEQRAG